MSDATTPLSPEMSPEMSVLRLTGVPGLLSGSFGAAESPRPDRTRKNAAVALILRPPPHTHDPLVSDCDILFIRRSESPNDPWSGQMALPGGRLDPDDSSLAAAAVRETEEETGVALDSGANLLGRLEPSRPYSVRIPKITIWPFVFRVPAGSGALPNSREVASVHWFPVEVLRDPRNRSVYQYRALGRELAFPCVRLQDQVIWGLTFRIVERFLGVTG